ncbi:MAG: D-tyrosyl-tRNA(Tyr) deacylase [Candidatus Obscuribacterales bacterium]|nr:D-tyrosyl-tRNA(Tyr) deacylase [Candidatus Obscuribacterales bacterium]
MKAVLQRASSASVVVDGAQVGAIGAGFVLLLCVEQQDSEDECNFLARKCSELRIFADQDGKMNLSLIDVKGSVLLISQFTLAADWKKGRRPGFTGAASPAEGKRLYEYFGKVMEDLGINVQYGVFGAHMDVSLTNDGPVTLMLDYRSNAN